MAKQMEGINGGFCGRVGTVVGYRWRGKWCMRAYRRQVNDPNSERQQGQRNRFVGMVRFAAQLREVLHAGMGVCTWRSHMTEGNYFVKLNKGCFGFEAGVLTIDYGQLRVSDGEVAAVGFGEGVCRRSETGWNIAVDFDRNPLHQTVADGDRVFLAAICSERSEAVISVPAYRRQQLVEIALPQAWQGGSVHLYGFVQAHDGEASVSSYLGGFRLIEESSDGDGLRKGKNKSKAATNGETLQNEFSTEGELADGLADVGSEGCELVGRHADVVSEVEVGGCVEGEEVDMSMRHVKANNGHANLDAGANLFQADGHLLGEELQLGIKDIVKVEEVIDLNLGDAKHMASHHGVDVEEGKAVVGFGHTMAGNFACDDFTEDTAHNGDNG